MNDALFTRRRAWLWIYFGNAILVGLMWLTGVTLMSAVGWTQPFLGALEGELRRGSPYHWWLLSPVWLLIPWGLAAGAGRLLRRRPGRRDDAAR